MKTRAEPFNPWITFAVVTLTLTAISSHAGITVGSTFGQTYVFSYNTGLALSNSVSVSGSSVSTTMGGFSASAAPAFLVAPDAATFTSGNFSLAASGFGYSHIYGYATFSVSEQTYFSSSGRMTGSVSVSGPGGTHPTLVEARVELSPFYTELERLQSPPVGPYSLELGDWVLSPGSNGGVDGSPVVTLQPGSFRFTFEAMVFANTAQLNGSGDFTFTLTTVPEPSVGALLLLPFGLQVMRRLGNLRSIIG